MTHLNKKCKTVDARCTVIELESLGAKPAAIRLNQTEIVYKENSKIFDI